MEIMIVELSDTHNDRIAAAMRSLQPFSQHAAHALAVTRDAIEDFAKALAEHYRDERGFDFDLNIIADEFDFSMDDYPDNSAKPKYSYFNNRGRGIARLGGKYPRYTSGFT